MRRTGPSVRVFFEAHYLDVMPNVILFYPLGHWWGSGKDDVFKGAREERKGDEGLGV
jgi:hypothetical protein